MSIRLGIGHGSMPLPPGGATPVSVPFPLAQATILPRPVSGKLASGAVLPMPPGPNMPVNYRPFISWDGSKKRLTPDDSKAGGLNYGSQCGNPDDDTEAVDTGVNTNNKWTVVDDPSNPSGSGKALRQLYANETKDVGVVVADPGNTISSIKTTLPGGAGAYLVGGQRSMYMEITQSGHPQEGRWARISAWDAGTKVLTLDSSSPKDSEKGLTSVPADGTALRVFMGHEQAFAGAHLWNSWKNYKPDPAFFPDWNGTDIIGEPSSIYFRAFILWESSFVNWHPAGGGKLWYFNDHDGTGAGDYYTWGSPGHVVSQLRNQGGDGFHGAGTGSGVFRRKVGGFASGHDIYHDIEVLWNAQSVQSAFDGSCYVWVNGDLCAEWGFTGDPDFSSQPLEDLQWTDFSNNDFRVNAAVGMQHGWFWGGNFGYPARQDQWMRRGGLLAAIP